MDHMFLWCATATVLNKLLCDSHETAADFNIAINNSGVKHNHYMYDLIIDDKTIRLDYEFESNTFIIGELTITSQDHDTPMATKYHLKRHDKAIRIYSGVDTYTEVHVHDKSIIAIHVYAGHKTMIDSISLDKHDFDPRGKVYDAIVNSVLTRPIEARDVHLHFRLFAIMGILDKDNFICPDVVTVNTNKLGMTVHTDGTRQLISVDMMPVSAKSRHNIGYINVLNSDFEQKYEYTYDPKTQEYNVIEYVTDHALNKHVKRDFRYKEQNGIITIPDFNRTYKVLTVDEIVDKRTIVFERI